MEMQVWNQRAGQAPASWLIWSVHRADEAFISVIGLIRFHKICGYSVVFRYDAACPISLSMSNRILVRLSTLLFCIFVVAISLLTQLNCHPIGHSNHHAVCCVDGDGHFTTQHAVTQFPLSSTLYILAAKESKSGRSSHCDSEQPL